MTKIIKEEPKEESKEEPKEEPKKESEEENTKSFLYYVKEFIRCNNEIKVIPDPIDDI